MQVVPLHISEAVRIHCPHAVKHRSSAICSTIQNTLLHEDALKQEQCARVFTDIMSGTRADRPEFLRMLDVARRGDLIVVWRLDRLGCSLKHLIETVSLLEARGIELRSIKDTIDTSTPTGKLMFYIMGAMAEFERDVIRERTQAGLDASRARGPRSGRPKASATMEPRNLACAKALYLAKQNTIHEIMQMTGFTSRTTFYKYVVHADL